MALVDHEPAEPIHQAAKDGEISVLSKASKKQLNNPDVIDGWTAVHWCAWHGDPGPLEIALNKGGNPNKLDKKGCSPLHVAATYGNDQAMELLIEHKSNIFALDNRGFHPSKVAALNRHIDCHRLLEALHHKLSLTNPEYVKAQQTKAINVLEKRLQKAEKAEKDAAAGKKISTSDNMGNKQPSRFRLGSRKKRSESNPESSQTFVLKDPSKKDDQPQEGTDGGQGKDEGSGDEDEDEFDPMFDPMFKSQSAKNTLRPLPKITSGAMLQTLEGVVGGARNRGTRFSDTASAASDPLMSSGGHQRARSTTKKANTGINLIGTIEPINPMEYELETDSPLITFLHSVDAYDTGSLLLEEKMDMTSLMLCSESDLKGIGIPLGPRKRIIDGIEKRAAVINNPTIMNEMIDTDL